MPILKRMKNRLFFSTGIFFLTSVCSLQASSSLLPETYLEAPALPEQYLAVPPKEEGNVNPYVIYDEVPPLLDGIWQGSDRLLLFSRSEYNEYACVLRTFYQWYDDRAAESARYEQLSTRDRNDTTVTPAEHITVRYITLCENQSGTAGAYELVVTYPNKKDDVYIPVAVIDDKLYLDFMLRGSALVTDFDTFIPLPERTEEGERSELDGYWRSFSCASGITISPPFMADELTSYYINGSAVYQIRYWLSEMDYSYEQAGFSDGEEKFAVDKYLRAAGNVYTCTTGKRSQIRNINKSNSLRKETTVDTDSVICGFGNPYLIKTTEKGQAELQKIIDRNNERRHPPLQPVFPVKEINFHWKEIDELRMYNPWTFNRRNIDLHK